MSSEPPLGPQTITLSDLTLASQVPRGFSNSPGRGLTLELAMIGQYWPVQWTFWHLET
jgi:hypothetical protein